MWSCASPNMFLIMHAINHVLPVSTNLIAALRSRQFQIKRAVQEVCTMPVICILKITTRQASIFSIANVESFGIDYHAYLSRKATLSIFSVVL